MLTAGPDLIICCVQTAHPCLPQAQGYQRRTRARHFFHLHAPKPRELHVRASHCKLIYDSSGLTHGVYHTAPSSLGPSPNRPPKFKLTLRPHSLLSSLPSAVAGTMYSVSISSPRKA